MLKNYLKVALRNVKRYKAHSFINIVGLATGLACCMLIFLYVNFELSYDRFHDDHHLVYRVASDMQYGDRLNEWACSAEPLGPTLRENFPGAGAVARVQELGRAVVDREGTLSYESRLIIADPQIFDVFSIPFLKGVPSGALDQPGTMVITESLSRKYSLGSEVIGQSLRINDQDFRITGVIADPPANSHLTYSGLLSFSTFEPNDNMFNWLRMSTYTYIRLSPLTDPGDLGEDINGVVGTIATEASSRAPGIGIEFVLQPLADIHLGSNRWGEFEAPGSKSYILVFACIGILILAIAVANFMNLSTARA
ncbi:MAG: ABC transporter permease, partial [Candidatus Zixiibacteriota bacterium]